MKQTILTLSVVVLFSTTVLCGNNHELAQYNIIALQEQDEQLKNQLLDPVFQFGKVTFKDGAISEQNFNYYLHLGQICYIGEDGNPLVLSDLSDIEKVAYGDRTFIPIDRYKSKVAEVLITFSDESMLLLQRQSKVTRVSDSSGPYGTSTETTTISRLNTMHEWDIHQPLEAESMYKRIVKESFLLMKSGKIHDISKLKSLKKIFRSNWKEIEAYAKENKTDFKNQQDLIGLLEFATR